MSFLYACYVSNTIYYFIQLKRIDDHLKQLERIDDHLKPIDKCEIYSVDVFKATLVQ